MPALKADRDMALQVRAVRAFAHRLGPIDPPAPERSIQDRAARGAVPSTGETEPTCKLFDAQAYTERLQGLKARSHSPDDGWAVPIRELERALAMGPGRTVARPPSGGALHALQSSFPHCEEVIEHVRRRVALARLVPDAPLRLPPLLLSGPPGVDKTAFSQRLAAALGVPLINVDVSTLETSFRLTGLDAGYATGKPGLIWDALQHPCMSPLVVLDEIDKLPVHSGAGLGFLLGLLEPSTATRFVDACVGVAVDASHIHWVATCNDPQAIDPALRSRLHEFRIDLPTPAQMPAVIQSVYQSLRESQAWGRAFDPVLSADVVHALGMRAPRDLWKSLGDVCANAALEGRRCVLPKDLPAAPQRIGGQKVGFV